ncbi:hypothetical protein [Aquibacillus kalidii]|uniref:hypothetical protein n=1 Tax=Aquibacillus kalidii TaxID=2762597 RepID=UPI001C99FBEA|nr:hypothetical protein [Aquibacillus kalidii]
MLIIFVLSLLVSCSDSNTTKQDPKSENEETIKEVLNQQFTVPDPKLTKLMNSPENTTVISDDENVSSPISTSELDQYLHELYGSYFTDKGYNAFIGAHALYFQGIANANNYELKVKKMDISSDKDTKGAYDFTVEVEYVTENEEPKIAEVIGKTHIYEEGKIAKFELLDDEGLTEAIKKD